MKMMLLLTIVTVIATILAYKILKGTEILTQEQAIRKLLWREAR